MTGLELILLGLITRAIREDSNPTAQQLAIMLENDPDYSGRRRGGALEREVERLLKSPRFLAELRSAMASDKAEDETVIGLKLGRLEINWKR